MASIWSDDLGSQSHCNVSSVSNVLNATPSKAAKVGLCCSMGPTVFVLVAYKLNSESWDLDLNLSHH